MLTFASPDAISPLSTRMTSEACDPNESLMMSAMTGLPPRSAVRSASGRLRRCSLAAFRPSRAASRNAVSPGMWSRPPRSRPRARSSVSVPSSRAQRRAVAHGKFRSTSAVIIVALVQTLTKKVR